jgi:hypothetical protein
VRTSPLSVTMFLSLCRVRIVGIVPSPRLYRRRVARTHHHRAEVLSFLAKPVHMHTCTREVVRRCMTPTNAAGPFLVVPPFFVPMPSV